MTLWSELFALPEHRSIVLSLVSWCLHSNLFLNCCYLLFMLMILLYIPVNTYPRKRWLIVHRNQANTIGISNCNVKRVCFPFYCKYLMYIFLGMFCNWTHCDQWSRTSLFPFWAQLLCPTFFQFFNFLLLPQPISCFSRWQIWSYWLSLDWRWWTPAVTSQPSPLSRFRLGTLSLVFSVPEHFSLPTSSC